MLRITALAALLSLTACAQMGRMPGMTDSQCVRWEMANGSNVSGPLPFTGAASRCAQLTGGQEMTGAGARYIPLDLRNDPQLQAMAENSDTNPYYPYVPRTSTAPLAGKRWAIQQ